MLYPYHLGGTCVYMGEPSRAVWRKNERTNQRMNEREKKWFIFAYSDSIQLNNQITRWRMPKADKVNRCHVFFLLLLQILFSSVPSPSVLLDYHNISEHPFRHSTAEQCTGFSHCSSIGFENVLLNQWHRHTLLIHSLWNYVAVNWFHILPWKAHLNAIISMFYIQPINWL